MNLTRQQQRIVDFLASRGAAWTHAKDIAAAVSKRSSRHGIYVQIGHMRRKGVVIDTHPHAYRSEGYRLGGVA